MNKGAIICEYIKENIAVFRFNSLIVNNAINVNPI